MADLSIVKSNVAKMVSMGAPESDIDSYIGAEGTTVDAVRNFKLPTSRPDRFALKSDSPGNSYTYGDAITDTGKTIVNSLANVGDSIINPILHPIKTAGNVLAGAGNFIAHPVDTIKNVKDNLGSTNNPDNVPNWAYGIHTDPLSFAGGVVGAGAVAKGIPEIAKLSSNGASNVGKFFNFDQKALSLGEKVRQVAAAAKQAEVDKFGADIDAQAAANPGKSVSLENVVSDIKTNLKDMPPEAQSVFRKVPILKDMLKEPGMEGYVDPANVSLKDTQGIINYINTKIPISIKANSLDVLDAQNDIRAAQLEAFSGMEKTRANYAQFAKDYKLLKGSLNPKATPGAILSNFSNNIPVKDAATRVLSPVMGDMAKLRGQVALANFLKKAGIGIVGTGVVAAGGGAALNAYNKFKH